MLCSGMKGNMALETQHTVYVILTTQKKQMPIANFKMFQNLYGTNSNIRISLQNVQVNI